MLGWHITILSYASLIPRIPAIGLLTPKNNFKMSIDTNLPVLLLLVIIILSDVNLCRSVETNVTDDASNHDHNIENSTSTPSNFDLEPFSFGTLHTIKNFSDWAVKDEEIFQLLGERLEVLEKEAHLIRRYLEDYKESSGNALDNLKVPNKTLKERGEVIGSSAVLGHLMVSRYSSVVSKLRTFFQSLEYTKNQENLNEVLTLYDEDPSLLEIPSLSITKKPIPEFDFNFGNSSQDNITNTSRDTVKTRSWPNWKDKYMSTMALIHIHEVYGFLPFDMRHGLEFDTHFGGNLNALNCAEIGIFAIYRQYYYMAIEWLELAKELLVEDPTDKSISLNLVSSLVNVAIQEHNRGFSSENRTYGDYYVNYTYEGEPADERLRGRTQLFYYYGGLGPEAHPNEQFYGLCSGRMYRTPAMQVNLKCYYERKSHPYVYINPVKVEMLSESPPVLQFYEVLGNRTIEQLKEITEPRMGLSQLVGEDELKTIMTFRTSVGAYFTSEELPRFFQFSQFASGLNIIDSAEHGQFVEYTYGRYYTYHVDMLEDEEETKNSVEIFGDRVATMLFNVEVPTYGGKTPFCNAGVSAYQEKGSAILWYNLYRNGTPRQDVYHGACPVVHGHKMVINHWIRYNSNFRNFKCSLNQFE